MDAVAQNGRPVEVLSHPIEHPRPDACAQPVVVQPYMMENDSLLCETDLYQRAIAGAKVTVVTKRGDRFFLPSKFLKDDKSLLSYRSVYEANLEIQLNQRVEVKPSPIDREGTFAKMSFKKGEVVGCYEGRLICRRKLPPLLEEYYWKNIDDDVFLPLYALWNPLASLKEPLQDSDFHTASDSHVAWTGVRFLKRSAELGIDAKNTGKPLGALNHNDEDLVNVVLKVCVNPAYLVRKGFDGTLYLRPDADVSHCVMIAVIARTDICAGDELTFYYGNIQDFSRVGKDVIQHPAQIMKLDEKGFPCFLTAPSRSLRRKRKRGTQATPPVEKQLRIQDQQGVVHSDSGNEDTCFDSYFSCVDDTQPPVTDALLSCDNGSLATVSDEISVASGVSSTESGQQEGHDSKTLLESIGVIAHMPESEQVESLWECFETYRAAHPDRDEYTAVIARFCNALSSASIPHPEEDTWTPETLYLYFQSHGFINRRNQFEFMTVAILKHLTRRASREETSKILLEFCAYWMVRMRSEGLLLRHFKKYGWKRIYDPQTNQWKPLSLPVLKELLAMVAPFMSQQELTEMVQKDRAAGYTDSYITLCIDQQVRLDNPAAFDFLLGYYIRRKKSVIWMYKAILGWYADIPNPVVYPWSVSGLTQYLLHNKFLDIRNPEHLQLIPPSELLILLDEEQLQKQAIYELQNMDRVNLREPALFKVWQKMSGVQKYSFFQRILKDVKEKDPELYRELNALVQKIIALYQGNNRLELHPVTQGLVTRYGERYLDSEQDKKALADDLVSSFQTLTDGVRKRNNIYIMLVDTLNHYQVEVEGIDSWDNTTLYEFMDAQGSIPDEGRYSMLMFSMLKERYEKYENPEEIAGFAHSWLTRGQEMRALVSGFRREGFQLKSAPIEAEDIEKLIKEYDLKLFGSCTVDSSLLLMAYRADNDHSEEALKRYLQVQFIDGSMQLADCAKGLNRSLAEMGKEKVWNSENLVRYMVEQNMLVPDQERFIERVPATVAAQALTFEQGRDFLLGALPKGMHYARLFTNYHKNQLKMTRPEYNVAMAGQFNVLSQEALCWPPELTPLTPSSVLAHISRETITVDNIVPSLAIITLQQQLRDEAADTPAALRILLHLFHKQGLKPAKAAARLKDLGIKIPAELDCEGSTRKEGSTKGQAGTNDWSAKNINQFWVQEKTRHQ